MDQVSSPIISGIHFGKPKDRLTVVQTISHETSNGEPVGIWSGFNRILQTEEQVWERRCTINEDWSKLDVGWFEDKECSQFLIRNEEGKNLAVNPSPEQRKEIATKVIEVSFTGLVPQCLIPAGESFRAMPATLADVYVRCRNGEANIIVNVFPL